MLKEKYFGSEMVTTEVLFSLKSGKKTMLRAKSQKEIDILPEKLYALSKMRNTNFKGDDLYEIQ